MGAGRSFSLGILRSLHAGVLSESPSQNARNRIQDDCLRLCKLSEQEGGEESGVPAQCSEMQSAPVVSETPPRKRHHLGGLELPPPNRRGPRAKDPS